MFVYSFFNFLSTEVFKLKQILVEKTVINHRQVANVMNECCTQVIKVLIDRINSIIEQKRDFAEITW